jgi:uncharacterized repeat protein (TIGR03803 family)
MLRPLPLLGTFSLALGLALTACSGGAEPTAGTLSRGVVPDDTRSAVQAISILYNFQGSPPGVHTSDLLDVNGTLYGTTFSGGGSTNCNGGCGTVFYITPSGATAILHRFTGEPDGSGPYGGLIYIGGVLYGTTHNGGANNAGTIFKMTTSGKESVLYSFAGSPDGAGPGGLLNIGGTMYGSTYAGGKFVAKCSGGYGCGTVYKVTTSGKEAVLYNFAGSPDGAGPGPLIAVGGSLYGTTFYGGRKNLGTVFKVTPSGKESVLHRFRYLGDGRTPSGALVNVGGTLYGTTSLGGANGAGTVYKITTFGTEESVIYNFGQDETDGANPYAGMVDVGGALYGTTGGGGGGPIGFGTVFRVSLSGNENVLHQFTDRSDGGYPVGELIDGGDRLYGTTAAGGTNNLGTVYSIPL